MEHDHPHEEITIEQLISFKRSQLLEISSRVYCAGLRRESGTTSPLPIDPNDAVQRAAELIRAVDDHTIASEQKPQ